MIINLLISISSITITYELLSVHGIPVGCDSGEKYWCLTRSTAEKCQKEKYCYDLYPYTTAKSVSMKRISAFLFIPAPSGARGQEFFFVPKEKSRSDLTSSTTGSPVTTQQILLEWHMPAPSGARGVQFPAVHKRRIAKEPKN